MNNQPERDAIEATETLTSIAELVFRDCKQNGFSKELSFGYNVLVSACHYLRTGSTMIGSRCEHFFA